MAVPRLRVSSSQPGGLREAAGLSSDEVELYHRTYTTLLRSSGETRLRVLEPSHAAMNSSLHPLAATSEPDLGAFMYAVRRLPSGIYKANPIVMGQEAVEFRRHGIGDLETWDAREAPARRRWWFDSGKGTMAVLLASTSDLDDLIPTLVAYQIEWNKLHAAECAEAFGGAEDDWNRVRDAWDGSLSNLPDEVSERRLNLRIRMLSGSQVGYARMTRRWMAPIRTEMDEQGLSGRPLYFVSSNTHSLVNLVTDTARSREAEIVEHIDQH